MKTTYPRLSRPDIIFGKVLKICARIWREVILEDSVEANTSAKQAVMNSNESLDLCGAPSTTSSTKPS